MPQPRYLDHPTSAQLVEIYQLRVAAWKPNPYFNAAQFPDGLFDALDSTAHHWIMEDAGRIVAAARVSIVECLTDIPNWQLFGGCELPDVSPLAYLSRLAILPAYQKQGWSRQFDQIRLAFIDEARIPYTICWSEKHRIEALQTQGFGVAGLVNSRYNFYDSTAFVQFRMHPFLSPSSDKYQGNFWEGKKESIDELA